MFKNPTEQLYGTRYHPQNFLLHQYVEEQNGAGNVRKKTLKSKPFFASLLLGCLVLTVNKRDEGCSLRVQKHQEDAVMSF